MHRPGLISIWFFIGVLLLAYGILITGVGLWEYISPPAQTTIIMPELHANFWWGLVLLAMGSFYSFKFKP